MESTDVQGPVLSQSAELQPFPLRCLPVGSGGVRGAGASLHSPGQQAGCCKEAAKLSHSLPHPTSPSSRAVSGEGREGEKEEEGVASTELWLLLNGPLDS